MLIGVLQVPSLEPPHVAQRGGRGAPQPGCSKATGDRRQAGGHGKGMGVSWGSGELGSSVCGVLGHWVDEESDTRLARKAGSWLPCRPASQTCAVHVRGAAVGRRALCQGRHRAWQLHAQREGIKVPAQGKQGAGSGRRTRGEAGNWQAAGSRAMRCRERGSVR